jgi:hypothetical protein
MCLDSQFNRSIPGSHGDGAASCDAAQCQGPRSPPAVVYILHVLVQVGRIVELFISSFCFAIHSLPHLLATSSCWNISVFTS